MNISQMSTTSISQAKAKAVVNAWLISQNQVNDLKRIVVDHRDLRNELLDALECLQWNYVMTPAKVRDKSFQKAGEEVYKLVWVFQFSVPGDTNDEETK